MVRHHNEYQEASLSDVMSPQLVEFTVIYTYLENLCFVLLQILYHLSKITKKKAKTNHMNKDGLI